MIDIMPIIDRDEHLKDLLKAGVTEAVIGIRMDLLKSHEAQAFKNHGGQSLKRLRERGGLSHCEAVAILMDRPWREMNPAEANAALLQLTKRI